MTTDAANKGGPFRAAVILSFLLAQSIAGAGFSAAGEALPPPQGKETDHLVEVRQLTRGGQNAEAYFSHDGERIIFQSTRPPYACDQIFTMNLDGGELRLLSTGKGRTTCSFLFPDGDAFLYASTHLGDGECPPVPDRSQGYVWALYPDYDIFLDRLSGGETVRLTDTPGYDAEGAVSPDGTKIVFTSMRDGDLELYLMDADGSNVHRLTDRVGFDGGPFFSWDGSKIVYRSHYPEEGEKLEDYLTLIRQNLMRPTQAEIFVMDADGSGKRQVTDTGHANWSPFMHPDGRRIIFSSNMHDPEGRTFSLYIVNIDGSGLERVTYGARFDSFPMFSKDGKKLIFSSSRNATEPREFNIFLADWKD